MVAMKDFSKKWSVVKICPFTGHITLSGHIKCYKWLYTYFSGYIFTNFQNIKCINRLKILRETMYVTQAPLAYKTLISTVVLSRHDVSHNNS